MTPSEEFGVSQIKMKQALQEDLVVDCSVDSVAGGSADLVGKFIAIFDPFRVGSSFAQDPVALPPATEFVAFDRSECKSPNSVFLRRYWNEDQARAGGAREVG